MLLDVTPDRQTCDPLMRENMFDESYNVRELLDDMIERVALREKLIQTAKQFSEKKREERFTLATKQFENLMADFLRLYQPVLDRLRNYREGLHKEIQNLKSGLATTNGMLEVTRGIEGLAAKIQQLEAQGQELETTIKEKSKTLEKIDDLLNHVRPFLTGMPPGMVTSRPLSDVLGNMPKDLYLDLPDPGKETPSQPRKSGARG